MLGHPVAHSLSPALHRAAYAALGLDWTYEPVDVTSEQLPGFVRGLDSSWAGLSLTMPLKRAIMPLLTSLSPLAASLGVVNTVTFGSAGPVGDNTDVAGLVVALREAGVSQVGSGHIIGGGATAVSAVAALAELGCASPVVHVRSVSRASAVEAVGKRLGAPVEFRPLEDRLRDPASTGADVVICTLPSGAADSLVSSLGAVAGVLLDVAYDPWPSVLASEWTAAGGVSVDGFEMLLHQAAEQVRLMTGLEPPVPVMRAAGLAARPLGSSGTLQAGPP